LSVYTNEDDCKTGFVAHDETATLTAIGGQPLYAYAERSIPPPDAVGAENDDAYVRFWQSNCPVYAREPFAVLGGWHFPWPDDDWELLRDRNLLVWTLKESEPWVEVWDNSGDFEVFQRIT